MEKLPASRNVAAAREQMKTKKHGTSRENGESIVHYGPAVVPWGQSRKTRGATSQLQCMIEGTLSM
jgi:hypothetical protein